MFGIEFWKQAAERAIKTAAQVAVAAIGTGAVGLMAVDWQAVVLAAALGAVLSVLTSVASEPFGAPGTPSLVGEESDLEWGHPDAPEGPEDLGGVE